MNNLDELRSQIQVDNEIGIWDVGSLKALFEKHDFAISTHPKPLTMAQKNIVIEAVLLGLPLPNVTVYNDYRKETWVFLHNYKPLEALFSFINGDFALSDLDVLSEYNGCRFEELPFQAQLLIRNFDIHLNIIAFYGEYTKGKFLFELDGLFDHADLLVVL